MNPIHILIVALLVVILVVVIKTNKRLEKPSLMSRLGSAAADIHDVREKLRGVSPSNSVENFSLPELESLVRKQTEQKRELRANSFSPELAFARLGNMVETCRENPGSSHHCESFMKYAAAMGQL